MMSIDTHCRPQQNGHAYIDGYCQSQQTTRGVCRQTLAVAIVHERFLSIDVAHCNMLPSVSIDRHCQPHQTMKRVHRQTLPAMISWRTNQSIDIGSHNRLDNNQSIGSHYRRQWIGEIGDQQPLPMTIDWRSSRSIAITDDKRQEKYVIDSHYRRQQAHPLHDILLLLQWPLSIVQGVQSTISRNQQDHDRAFHQTVRSSSLEQGNKHGRSRRYIANILTLL